MKPVIYSGEMGGSSSWTRPSAPGCDTSKAPVSHGSILGGDRPRRRRVETTKSGFGVALDWVTGQSYSFEAGRRLYVQSGLRKDKVHRSQHCMAERGRP